MTFRVVFTFSGLNTVDFIQKVSEQTKMLQHGLKTLRGEENNPLDIGQEAIVLSGFNRPAREAMFQGVNILHKSANSSSAIFSDADNSTSVTFINFANLRYLSAPYSMFIL